VVGLTTGSREVPGKKRKPVTRDNNNKNNNNNKNFTKISENNTRITLNRFPTKNCHSRNITHRKESATS
jgi:hypothetical protein